MRDVETQTPYFTKIGKPEKDDDADLEDTDMFGGDDDDDDNPPPGPGGGGGRVADPESEIPAAGNLSRNDGSLFVDDASRGPKGRRRDGGSPPPPSAGIAYREAVEVKAELDALRQELQRQAQSQAMAEEIRRGMQVRTPVKELIREIHQVQPIPVPTAIPVPAFNTNQLMEAAKKAHVDIGMLTEKLAISRAQLAEAISRKPPAQEVSASSPSGGPPPPPAGGAVRGDRSRSGPKPEVVASSSSMPPPPPPASRMARSRSPPGALPPPPPPPEASMAATRALSGGSQPPEKRGRPETISIATPRERMASRQPSVITVDSSRKASVAPSSRAASGAPTVNYGPSPQASRSGSAAASRAASRQPSVASTVNYGSSREQSAKRAPSAASVASDATRSRSRGRPLLPIEEAPSRRETVRKVIQQMQEATASDDAKVKASMRMHLSRFARSVAPPRQSRQAAPKRAKSFDELEAEAEIMEQALPFGAATQRQKTGPTVPDWQRRFQGRLVRPTSR